MVSSYEVGTIKHSNLKKLQAIQSINLRLLTSCSWYVSNFTLHNDWKIPTTSTLASIHYKIVHINTINYPNLLISNLFSLTLSNNPPVVLNATVLVTY